MALVLKSYLNFSWFLDPLCVKQFFFVVWNEAMQITAHTCCKLELDWSVVWHWLCFSSLYFGKEICGFSNLKNEFLNIEFDASVETQLKIFKKFFSIRASERLKKYQWNWYQTKLKLRSGLRYSKHIFNDSG